MKKKKKSEFDESEKDELFEQLMEKTGVIPFEGKKNFEEDYRNAPFPDVNVRYTPKEDDRQFQDLSNQKKKKRYIPRDFEPDDRLDLHGETSSSAISKVQNYILYASRRKLDAILIITGKGLHSGSEGAILRDRVWNWLERNSADTVNRFQWAPSFLGGNGAILLFLK
ncbi:MAG: DNA-nicking Smr family endonuclease [bacterium]|jgi:DNA-nicking Smr family endonuclease